MRILQLLLTALLVLLLAETVPGGRYLKNGVLVNAHGEAIVPDPNQEDGDDTTSDPNDPSKQKRGSGSK